MSARHVECAGGSEPEARPMHRVTNLDNVVAAKKSKVTKDFLSACFLMYPTLTPTSQGLGAIRLAQL